MTGPGIVPVEWRGDTVAILDQRALPHREVVLECHTAREVAGAIESLAVRGAPIIGIAAAYGMALAATVSTQERTRALLHELEDAARTLKGARPTAVNLAWAVDRMMTVATGQCCSVGSTLQRVHEEMVAEAIRIEAEDRDACSAMGALGQELVPEDADVLTHCNTGMLCAGGHRHGARGRDRGAPSGQACARLGRRDPTGPPGRPAHGVGARQAADPPHADRGRRCGIAHGAGEGRPRDRGSRSDRGERRRGQQGGDVPARGARAAARVALLRGGPGVDGRPRRRPPAGTSRSRSATRPR